MNFIEPNKLISNCFIIHSLHESISTQIQCHQTIESIILMYAFDFCVKLYSRKWKWLKKKMNALAHKCMQKKQIDEPPIIDEQQRNKIRVEWARAPSKIKYNVVKFIFFIANQFDFRLLFRFYPVRSRWFIQRNHLIRSLFCTSFQTK